jgi:hypothetical protein
VYDGRAARALSCAEVCRYSKVPTVMLAVGGGDEKGFGCRYFDTEQSRGGV